MFHTTEDIRIKWTKVVLPPVFLEEERPVTEAASATIFDARNEICDILNGRDSRLLVLAGPCSIHDTKAAREYAALLKTAIDEFSARPAHRHARLLREASHHHRLEGAHQRSLSRRVLQDQRRPAPGAPPAARSGRDGRSRRNRIPRHDFAAVHRRTGELGSHRRAHHREPGASPTGLGRLLPGGLQERHLRRRADRHRRHSLRRPLAHLPGTHQAWPVRHLRHHRESGLPHHPARRPQDGELHGGERSRNRRARWKRRACSRAS